MKRVCVLFICFLMTWLVVDRIVGAFLFSSFTKSKEFRKIVECRADVVILGSSRAIHHYVPSVISDSLRMSCYNLGHDGKNIYYQYAVLNLLLQYNHPRTVIIDCYSIDVEKSSNFVYNWGALTDFYPYYGRNDSLDVMIGKMGLKHSTRINISHTYRYNTRFLDYFVNGDINNCGYEPVFGKIKEVEPRPEKSISPKIDQGKIDYLRRLIDICHRNEISVVVSVSPRFSQKERTDMQISEKYEVVKELCDNTNTPFMYYEFDSLYLSHSDWFKDVAHLNDEGSHVFSSYFAHDLKCVFQNN